jgi:flavin-binding protein dodecin
MAKNKDKDAGVYRIVDVIGVSAVSWEDAAKRAVETAATSTHTGSRVDAHA